MNEWMNSHDKKCETGYFRVSYVFAYDLFKDCTSKKALILRLYI
jgi:hypothetical protein